jgi:branched chain amino acid efflux pump
VTWLAIAASSVGCYLAKLAGTLVPQRSLDRPRVQVFTQLLPVALFASVIVVQTVSSARHLVADARLIGLGVAALAVWRRLPFLAVLGLAALATTLARLLGMP